MGNPNAKPIPNGSLGKEYHHCLDELPYRSIVFIKLDGNATPVYRVAGSADAAVGARKAMERASKLYETNCFYCRKPSTDITIDHVEPIVRGGSDSLQNLVIACKPCNSKKGPQAIEVFNPKAGRAWLQALLSQIQSRLNGL